MSLILHFTFRFQHTFGITRTRENIAKHILLHLDRSGKAHDCSSLNRFYEYSRAESEKNAPSLTDLAYS